MVAIHFGTTNSSIARADEQGHALLAGTCDDLGGPTTARLSHRITNL